MKLLILGASGLVGSEVLKRALADARIESIYAPTRRPLANHAKLVNQVATELDGLLPSAAGWAVDAVVCAIGTTMSKAGSKEAFRHADYMLPLKFAELTHARGTDTFALVSSKGASASSFFFYTRTKGELERDLEAVGFKSLLIARPNIIGGDRQEFRLAERLALWCTAVLNPVLPRSLRISRSSRIAEVLLEAAVAPSPGLHVFSSETFV